MSLFELCRLGLIGKHMLDALFHRGIWRRRNAGKIEQFEVVLSKEAAKGRRCYNLEAVGLYCPFIVRESS
jgi:hypothetical protein